MTSITNMRTRATNYRNHIRTNHKGCEIATHFAEFPENHTIAFPENCGKSESLAHFNEHLAQQIQFTIIDKVNFPPNATTAAKKEIINKAEAYWQTQLRTMKHYGGLNVRDERKIKNSKIAKMKTSTVAESSDPVTIKSKNSKPPPKFMKNGPKTQSTVPYSQPLPTGCSLDTSQESSVTLRRSKRNVKKMSLPR